MGAVDIFVFRVDGPVLPFVVTAYHRSFRYVAVAVAVDVAVIVYKVALRLVRGIFLFFTLFISFISFIFYFVLISSSSLLYFFCFSLLLLMIDLVCVGAGKT